MSIEKNKKQKLGLIVWLIIPAILMGYLSFYIINDVNLVEAEKNNINQKRQKLSNEQTGFLIQKQQIKPKIYDSEKYYITLWFDDAWLSQYTTGYKLVEKYSYKGAIAVPTGYMEFPGYTDWQKLREMQASGWEMTAHSVTHDCTYHESSDENIEYELKNSRDTMILQGLSAEHYVSPCGVWNENVLNKAKKYYKSFRQASGGLNTLPIEDNFKIKAFGVGNETTTQDVKNYLDQVKAQNAWGILMFHEIVANPDEFSSTPQDLENILQLLNEESEEIEVVLPSEVIYMKYET